MHQDSFHRFHLDRSAPRRKHECPQCHDRRSLVLFVDDQGEFTDQFALNHVGICDHKNRCGYDKRPSDYFAENPATDRQFVQSGPRPKPQPASPLPMLTIDPSIMQRTMQGYANNAFFQFVSRLVGEERTHEAFRLYNVGTAKLMGWSTVFWQVDVEGRIRTGKIMKYGQDGHRIKVDGSGKVNWVHSLIRVSGCRMVQCFFGEHLLSTRPDATVVLVEAEKTAVIASLFFPDFLWLASGGNNGCINSAASQVLKDREVKLLPDLGMEEDWLKKAEMLRPICKSVELLTWLSNQATEEQRAKGLDVADFIVEALLPPTSEPKTDVEAEPTSDLVLPSNPVLVAESVDPFYDPAEWPWPPPDPNEVCPF